SARQFRMVEYMIAFEVFWSQPETNAALQTTDAETAAIRLHARRFPDRVFHDVDFGIWRDRHRVRGIAVYQELGQLARRCPRIGVVCAVDAIVVLGHQALEA